MASIIKADTWQTTTGNTALQNTTTGYVNFPNKPIMSGQIGSSGTFSAAQKIPFDDFWVQRGITYDSSLRRFTVPATGIYRITMNPFKLESAGGTRVLVGINSDTPTATSHRGMCYASNGAVYQTMNLNSIVSLNSGDWIVFYLLDGSLYNSSNDRFNQFTIEMIA